jgi:hypothetical protein
MVILSRLRGRAKEGMTGIHERRGLFRGQTLGSFGFDMVDSRRFALPVDDRPGKRYDLLLRRIP